MNSNQGLVDMPAPSYQYSDLLAAAGHQYWPSIALVALLIVIGLPTNTLRLTRAKSLITSLPLLAWALQLSYLVGDRFDWPVPLYILWHDFFVAMVGLACILMLMVLGSLAVREPKARQQPGIAAPIWGVVVIAAPFVDLVLLICASSPVGAVFKLSI